jgi:general secretion pathway protein F
MSHTAPALTDFILLNEEIAALARARIPLEANLERIGADLPGKSGQLAERIGRRMQAGECLAEAMNAECASMPAAYRAAIVAGAQSGQLGSALTAIADSASRSDQLRRIAAVAMLYPLVLIVIICLLLAVMIAVVVPTFGWLDHSMFKPVESLTQSSLTIPTLALVLPVILIATAAVWWWRTGRLGGDTSHWGPLSALTGRVRVQRWSQASQFAETLLLLIDRGLPLAESLRLAGEASNDSSLRRAADQEATQIELGNTANESSTTKELSSRPSFPVLIRLALHHADNRNLMSTSLRQAASMYHERAVRSAEWYSEYLPVLLTVVVGGTVTIGFALFVLWPYASMLHEIANWNWALN